MWESATYSELRRPASGRVGRRWRFAAVVALVHLTILAAPMAAGVYLSADEAIDLAFPGCEVERASVFLTDAQLERARELVGGPVDRALVYPYRAECPGGDSGTAYFDTHRVRTLMETLMIAIGSDGAVRRIEILAFREPAEYIPRDVWYRQFVDRELDARLDLKRGIRGVTGATLTARATTQAVRRVLAIHRVIEEAESE